MSEEFALAGRKISRITRSLGETASFDSLWVRFRFSCVLSCSFEVSCSFFWNELVSVVVSGAGGFLSERYSSCGHPSTSREWRVRLDEENGERRRKETNTTIENPTTITNHTKPPIQFPTIIATHKHTHPLIPNH